ncbi:MAG: Hsp33 family molecular chaperone HslO [Methylocystaceae bacterium]
MDELIKAIDRDREVRLVIARTTVLTGELSLRHHMSATACAASGRLATGALLLASDLKTGNGVTIQVNGGGPVGNIVAVAEPEGTARLYVENPNADLPSKRPGKLDVGGLVGTNGFLSVIKDMGLKQPFTGSVPLQTGEIGDDIAYYLFASEQVASLVALGVLVNTDLSVLASGGLLIQALPGVSDDKLAMIEEKIGSLEPLSNLVYSHSNLDEILNLVMGAGNFEVLERISVSFSCRCSREKLISIIKALPEEDIDASLKEMGQIEARCNFCNETYTFNEEEVSALRQ